MPFSRWHMPCQSCGCVFCRYSMLPMTVPQPVMSLAIMAKTREGSGGFSKALNRFTKEDPTFKVVSSPKPNPLYPPVPAVGLHNIMIYLRFLPIHWCNYSSAKAKLGISINARLPDSVKNCSTLTSNQDAHCKQEGSSCRSVTVRHSDCPGIGRKIAARRLLPVHDLTELNWSHHSCLLPFQGVSNGSYQKWSHYCSSSLLRPCFYRAHSCQCGIAGQLWWGHRSNHHQWDGRAASGHLCWADAARIQRGCRDWTTARQLQGGHHQEGNFWLLTQEAVRCTSSLIVWICLCIYLCIRVIG